MVQPLQQFFPKKLNVEFFYMMPQFHFSVYTYLKELKARFPRGICICTPVFIAALFTKARKQPKCPVMNEWVNKIGLCPYK